MKRRTPGPRLPSNETKRPAQVALEKVVLAKTCIELVRLGVDLVAGAVKLLR